MNYEAASIEAKVKVEAYLHAENVGRSSYARRTVEISFKEVFSDDAELELALKTFTESVIAAARRG